MNEARKDNVRSLTEEKYTALSELNNWPIEFAEGYIAGQTERRRGNPLSSYIMTGMDQYALGFRTGYFNRSNPNKAGNLSGGNPVAKSSDEKSAATVA